MCKSNELRVLCKVVSEGGVRPVAGMDRMGRVGERSSSY